MSSVAGRSEATRSPMTGLDRDWYTDPAILEREHEQIFHSGWQLAGVTTEIPEVGDFLTYMHVGRAGRFSVVVTRDQKGEIQAMVNTCRHRGSLVVTEPHGNKKVLQCPYHAWTYDLDGRLRAAPRSKQNPCFNADPDANRLFPLRVTVIGPLIFVNADQNAPAFEETFADWRPTVHGDLLDAEALTEVAYVQERWSTEVECNWKLLLENTIECYHCGPVHPSFAAFADVKRDMEYDFHENHFHQRTIPLGDTPENPIENLPASQLWPNVQVHLMQDTNGDDDALGGGIVGTGAISGLFIATYEPIAVDRVKWTQWWTYRADVDEAEKKETTKWGIDISYEDMEVSEKAQVGMAGGLGGKVQLMLPNSEASLQWFQERVYNSLEPTLGKGI